MELAITQAGAVCVVAVHGSIDGSTSPQLQQELSAQVGQRSAQLVIDCGALEYTSSAGLRTLLTGMKDSRRLGGDLRLAAVQSGVRKVLELSGFTGILKIYPDVQAAVASYAG
ncbi:MAG: STAS domain-containing protein [Candidatus Binataceae bacterium]